MTFLVLHIAACALMTGLIWTVQLLLYPAFAFVEPNQFVQFHLRHSRVITWIVGPIMLLELATGILFFFQSPGILFQISLALLILIWVCTACLSVPIHNRLSLAWDQAQIAKLIWTNWPRTILWSVRLVILLGILVGNLGGVDVDIR